MVAPVQAPPTPLLSSPPLLLYPPLRSFPFPSSLPLLLLLLYSPSTPPALLRSSSSSSSLPGTATIASCDSHDFISSQVFCWLPWLQRLSLASPQSPESSNEQCLSTRASSPPCGLQAGQGLLDNPAAGITKWRPPGSMWTE